MGLLELDDGRAVFQGIPLLQHYKPLGAAHGGRQIATAEARIEDEKGKLYAHGTTTCLVFNVPAT